MIALLAQSDEPLIRWAWIGDHLDEVWARTIEHVQLAVVAILIGSLISVALSVIAIRYRRTYGPITWFAGLLYTIPSLALFGFLIPYTGLGFTTAEVGLVSYTLLILVRNIVAGIDGVPAEVREAADGMGYTPTRRLLLVEMPLAAPTIVAGLRIASVTVVGLVTVTSLVGAGGYGVFILDGLNRQFPTPIILGIVLSVAFAGLVDVAFVALEGAITPWQRSSQRSGESS